MTCIEMQLQAITKLKERQRGHQHMCIALQALHITLPRLPVLAQEDWELEEEENFVSEAKHAADLPVHRLKELCSFVAAHRKHVARDKVP